MYCLDYYYIRDAVGRPVEGLPAYSSKYQAERAAEALSVDHGGAFFCACCRRVWFDDDEVAHHRQRVPLRLRCRVLMEGVREIIQIFNRIFLCR